MTDKIIAQIIDSKKIRILSECLCNLENGEYNHLINIRELSTDYEYQYYNDNEYHIRKWGEEERNIFTELEWINLSEATIIADLGEIISEVCGNIHSNMFEKIIK